MEALLNQPLPLPVFILIIITIISWPLVRKYASKFLGRSRVKLDKPASSFSLLKWGLRDPVTRRRLSISVLLCCGLGLAYNIPFPGIQSQDFSYLDLQGLNQLFPEFHFSIFLLGITPFLFA